MPINEILHCFEVSGSGPIHWFFYLFDLVGLLASLLLLSYLLFSGPYFLLSKILEKVKPVIEEKGMPLLRPLPVPTKNQNIFFRWMVYLYVPRKWKLERDWYCEYTEKDMNKVTLVIPRGFVCDIASIPRPFRAFFGQTGLLLLPALLHDYAFMYNHLWQVDASGNFTKYNPCKNKSRMSQKFFWDNLLFRTGMQINGSWFVNGAIRLLSLFLTSCTWWSYRRAQAKYKNPRLKPKPPVICSLV